MIINVSQPKYTEFKLYRSSEWDNYDFKGHLPDGKWQTIYSNFVGDNWKYASEVIMANYQVNLNNVRKVG